MGIRFYCPNGHKLNVKEFQAGRKGVCPHCGAKFVVPLESTRKSSKQLRAEGAEGEEGGADTPADGVANPVAVNPAAVAGPMPVVAGAAAAGGEPARAAPAGPLHPAAMSAPAQVAPAHTASVQPVAGSPGGPGGPPHNASAQAADPLLEAGDVVWYVRPASGGQYGPATPDIMREWIAEGRVAADSLVWREGWRDWQEASSVFPQFSAGRVESLPGAFTTGVSPAITTSGNTPAIGGARPWNPRTIQTAVISALMLAIVVLLAIFIFVLFQDPGEQSSGAGMRSSVVPRAAVAARTESRRLFRF